MEKAGTATADGEDDEEDDDDEPEDFMIVPEGERLSRSESMGKLRFMLFCTA